ncbi:hypothetical protein CTA_0249 [Chlamydia trachomatis A/HAR-13]|uniref:Uncharacterized protein n=1 Tax=Chlamydia trachomatis serovar A (strain ATCC VR-571B / DSM 19440 / HAR-13) TaxID=315277 RepID=A0A0H2X0Q8_CHLTA|nr:hypothetical protein CTA_0249 [Chlamydia trachomatis A/HAR-13]
MSYLFCSSCAPTLESPAELCLYKTHIYCKRRGNIEFAVSLGIFAILSCVALLCLLCGGSSLVFAGLGIGAIMHWFCGFRSRVNVSLLVL